MLKDFSQWARICSMVFVIGIYFLDWLFIFPVCHFFLMEDADLNNSARISANFPTGNGLKDFFPLKCVGQIDDNK